MVQQSLNDLSTVAIEHEILVNLDTYQLTADIVDKKNTFKYEIRIIVIYLVLFSLILFTHNY